MILFFLLFFHIEERVEKKFNKNILEKVKKNFVTKIGFNVYKKYIL